MKWLIRIGIALLVVLVGIQFIPARFNKKEEVTQMDFVKTYPAPENIVYILKSSCYDCHSNETVYPWYSKVQPTAWLLESHISKAKAELNFSEFGSYSIRKQKSKLKSILSQIEKDQMPLASYKFIHREARLTQESKNNLTEYMNTLLDDLENSRN